MRQRVMISGLLLLTFVAAFFTAAAGVTLLACLAGMAIAAAACRRLPALGRLSAMLATVTIAVATASPLLVVWDHIGAGAVWLATAAISGACARELRQRAVAQLAARGISSIS